MKVLKMEFTNPIRNIIEFKNELDILVNDSPFNINVYNVSSDESQLINVVCEDYVLKKHYCKNDRQ